VPLNSSAEIATLDEFKAFGEKFDHLTTGFALTGEHIQLDCGECHIGGVFETLPRECDACHDNVIATGKNSNHIQTTQPCDVCHNTGAFLVSAIMDHSITEGNCVSCHDGVSAIGKPVNHIASTDVCDACHSVNFWVPVLTVDHEHTLGSCSNCHNGVIATGKPSSHIPSTDVCEACHLATAASDWPAFQVDHAHVLGACSVCHQLPNDHIDSTDTCQACHTAGDTWVPTFIVDHAHVLGACTSCHANDKDADHVITTEECNACHRVPPNTWADATALNHATLQGQACSGAGCHDAVAATGKPNDQLHVNVTDQCQACHGTGGGSFNPALRVDHNEVLGACQSCHDGVVAIGKPVGHIITTEDCGACHNTTDWRAAVDHANLQGQACASAGCHDNTKPANHINTTNLCEACHLPSPSAWINIAGVDHDQVLGDCGTCHNGITATGKPNNHVDTSNQCGACHSTATFNPVNQVDHS